MSGRKLNDAAEAGDEALVSQLIGQGATPDWKGPSKWTALHRAAIEGHTPVVTRLLDAGWSLEARDWDGNTPLTLAAARGHQETVKCLLLRGANIDCQCNAKDTPLHEASSDGRTEMIKTLLLCGANQQIRGSEENTAEEKAKNDKTREVFRRFNKKGLNTKEGLFNQAISEENYEAALILIVRGANFDLIRFSYSILISMLKIMNKTNVPWIREAIENYLLLNIEVKEEDSGNTPLHAVAKTNNEQSLKYLLSNGASTTQFMKNKDGKIPLEISKNNQHMFGIILLDFLNYALKSSKFPSNEFQKQLGSGLQLFCLKRDFDGNKTLLEFLYDQGMIKEREEVIQLLIKIDYFRYQGAEEKKNSKRRIIKILRAGMKPSRGLKESIDSVQEKYSWENGKIAVKCGLSVVHNIILGWGLYGSDVASDWVFFTGLNDDAEAKIASLIHIILPFFFAFFVFFPLLCSRIIKFDRYLLFKIPLSPFTKFHKTVVECRLFVNNKNKEDAKYEQNNTDLIQELEDQKIITTTSMILESGLESSFQFLFQASFSLPTMVFAYLDIYEGKLSLTQLVNWKNVSIVLSFLSFAFTSFNIRYVVETKMLFKRMTFSFIHSGIKANMKHWRQNICLCSWSKWFVTPDPES